MSFNWVFPQPSERCMPLIPPVPVMKALPTAPTYGKLNSKNWLHYRVKKKKTKSLFQIIM